MKTKIGISVLLLLISAGIVFVTVRQLRRVSRVDEFIQVSESNIILNTRYRYAYTSHDSSITQTLIINPFNSNVVGVYTVHGEPINYSTSTDLLFVIFNEPIMNGDVVEYVVKTELDASYPYFNIVNHAGNSFTLHYISMDPSCGGMQTKKFVLPDNAQILKVNSSMESVEMENNEIVVKNTSDDFDRFDISISFAMNIGSVKHIKAYPPLIDADSNVVIRASKEIYSSPPTLRGDFTGWAEVQMVDEGDFYIYKTNLEQGRYYYQFRSESMPSSDDSVADRQIIIGDESASVMTIEF